MSVTAPDSDHTPAQASPYERAIELYAAHLDPLFDGNQYMHADSFFEFVCAIVRAGGMQDPRWDAWDESQDFLKDIEELSRLPLDPKAFPAPNRTHLRLSLMAYCHITEMDLPYSLLANLLRVRAGLKYKMSPFADLATPVTKKKKGGLPPVNGFRPPSPLKKIRRISELAEKAGMQTIADDLAGVYDNIVRNAFFHSDYTLTDDEMRLLGAYHSSKKRSYLSQHVDRDELEDLLTNAFAFYSALFGLYERCRKSFLDFKDAFLPWEPHYKGLMQLLFDEQDRVSGFRVYWPNHHYSQYSRTATGTVARNVAFNADGSYNFMVGLYASQPGKFSPLVEVTQEPLYPEVPGSKVRPHWPQDGRPYKLPTGGGSDPKEAERGQGRA